MLRYDTSYTIFHLAIAASIPWIRRNHRKRQNQWIGCHCSHRSRSRSMTSLAGKKRVTVCLDWFGAVFFFWRVFAPLESMGKVKEPLRRAAGILMPQELTQIELERSGLNQDILVYTFRFWWLSLKTRVTFLLGFQLRNYHLLGGFSWRCAIWHFTAGCLGKEDSGARLDDSLWCLIQHVNVLTYIVLQITCHMQHSGVHHKNFVTWENQP